LSRKIIEAGLCAPSGGSMQNWRFIVVKDPEIKRQIQIRYKRALNQVMPRLHAAAILGKTEAQKIRRLHAVEYLTDDFHEAPVMLVACRIGELARSAGIEEMSGSVGLSCYAETCCWRHGGWV
jgi:nitroreductase